MSAILRGPRARPTQGVVRLLLGVVGMKTRITLVGGVYLSSRIRCQVEGANEPAPESTNETAMLSIVADGYEMVIHGDPEGRCVHLEFIEDQEWRVGMSFDAMTGLFEIMTRSGRAMTVLDAHQREGLAVNDPRQYVAIRASLGLDLSQVTDLDALIRFDRVFAKNGGLLPIEDAPTAIYGRPIARCGLIGRALSMVRCIAAGSGAARVLARGDVIELAL